MKGKPSKWNHAGDAISVVDYHFFLYCLKLNVDILAYLCVCPRPQSYQFRSIAFPSKILIRTKNIK